jgi:hypothetical protein
MYGQLVRGWQACAGFVTGGILSAVLLGMLVGCATPRPAVDGPALPADGAALLATLASDSIEGWDLFPGRRERYPGSGEHGQLVSVRINKTAAEGLLARPPAFPPGSVLVNQGFSPSGDPSGMVVMAKIRGYARESGDWFWAAFDAQGKVVAEGKSAACVTCHAKVKSNDLVFTGPFR